MTMPRYLFVYGTLMRGMESSELMDMAGARFAAPGYITGDLYDLGSYPAVVKSVGQNAVVVGEIYELRQVDAIDVLDQFESYRPRDETSLFIRETATARRMDTGKPVRVWTYFYNPRRSLRRAKRIESGDYRMAKAS